MIKNADMSEDMQQDAIDCATQVRPRPAPPPRMWGATRPCCAADASPRWALARACQT